ncbi:MAG: nucleotidyl transferase AbiEii/AbiGii toxin family protein [bacterium]|nr:nucleotidyl transferase AbiEii/AbiGii toxin family protein [bacterium]
MSFLHEDPELRELLTIVAEAVAIDRALVEKDYWVTHTLWALQRSELAVWFKGGTSLSKGFGLIQRFSEDLDLRVEPGNAAGVQPVRSWTSMNRGPIRQRRAFFEALDKVIDVTHASVSLEPESIDKYSRSARYRVEYPGLFLEDLGPDIRPFVLLEVGSARVTPHVPRTLSSFVHDWLEEQQQLGDVTDNRPRVRCVHPLVTLIEKLDAVSRRFPRDPMEPASFIRHYGDAARIIVRQGELPALGMEIEELIEEMVSAKQIRRRPTPDDPAWLLQDASVRQALLEAHQSISPMFWGERFSLEEACGIIRGWLATSPPGRAL